MFNLKINMYAIYDNLDLIATFNLGNEDMVQAFFSTIAYRLENKTWGSIYPAIMNEFYKGKLEQEKINQAIEEIKDIKKKFSKLSVSQMILNIEESIEEETIKLNMINLDDWFVNNKGEKITDIILTVLKSIQNKKIPLYIGKYYYKELINEKNIDIINKTQKKLKIKNIFKYISYVLIAIILKLIVDEQQFNHFIKIFIFLIFISELIIFHAKQNLKQKQKETIQKREINNNKPQIMIEKITLKRDLRSSIFDNILDEIKCSKSYDKIKQKLKLNIVNDWKSDIEKIYQDLGYNTEYAMDMISDLEQLKDLKIYELKDISKVIPKRKRYYVYGDNNIYRILENSKEMYILTFKK